MQPVTNQMVVSRRGMSVILSSNGARRGCQDCTRHLTLAWRRALETLNTLSDPFGRTNWVTGKIGFTLCFRPLSETQGMAMPVAVPCTLTMTGFLNMAVE